MTKKFSASGIFLALLAATLYALCSPVTKVLVAQIPPFLMASLLYLGTGAGMCAVRFVQKAAGKLTEPQLEKKDMKWFFAIVPLDVAATILLTEGIAHTAAANASLLNNFEIVATAVIALVLFKEKVSRLLWAAIALITAASLILSFEDMSSFSFSIGSLFVLLSCVGWGFENNCTRQLADHDPLEVVELKGLLSGSAALVVSLLFGERFWNAKYIAAALALGFVSFGLSNFFYIFAQRKLGAAKTSAYYAVSPFIGTALSFALFRTKPSVSFMIALAVMIAGAYLAAKDGAAENDASAE